MSNSLNKTPPKKIKAPEWVPVDAREVVVVTQDHKLFIGGEQLTEIELKNLQAEVKALKTFRIWSLFQNTVKQKAIETGFIKAETWERTMAGKMMLLNLDVLRSIVDAIEKVPPLHTPMVARPPKITHPVR